MMAAMGAARKTPASQGSTSIMREGMILSGLSMPGRDGGGQGPPVHAEHQRGADHGADGMPRCSAFAVAIAETAQGESGAAPPPRCRPAPRSSA